MQSLAVRSVSADTEFDESHQAVTCIPARSVWWFKAWCARCAVRERKTDTRLEIVTGTAFVHVEASIDKIPRAGRGARSSDKG